MNNKFKSFYQLTNDDLSKIWSSEETIFVFDTNVLLNLYQYSSETQKGFFKTLVAIQNRVWIPFHVALEYQRRRLDVIRNEKSIPRDMLKKITEIEEMIEKHFSFSDFKLKTRNPLLFDKEQKLQKNISSLVNNFKKEVEKVDRKQPCVRSLDVIRNKLDEILETRIGDEPEQLWLDNLYIEGQERYDKNIPPGYADESKGKDIDYASFTFDGVFYERKFGDLIIWKQTIDYVKDKENIKNVIFITDDSKEDWWEIVNSSGKKNIGARQELKAEVYKEGKIEDFKMYRTNDFLSDARSYLSVEIDDKAIEEAKGLMEYSNDGIWPSQNRFQIRDEESEQTTIGELLAQIKESDSRKKNWPSQSRFQTRDEESEQTTIGELLAQIKESDSRKKNWPSQSRFQTRDKESEQTTIGELLAQIKESDSRKKNWPSQSKFQTRDEESEQTTIEEKLAQLKAFKKK
ncbi:PIN-like domain-containing protein [Psychrobacter sp. Pi2-51]|uniref:PIN-like domain-containing protein n=1 Tax=Psychrobacter sp. Pi2-51 TaxID=2774132 RepID=UPI00191952CB|nr:PIN-like domain-containing protein [Psychrobacter sp. Pi2-51]